MTLPLASFFNLAGPDLIIILFILFMLGLPIGCVLYARGYLGGNARSAPRSPSPSGPPPIPSVADRLQKLELLRQQGHISEVEYEEQRQRILNSI
jgi:hypothetical protein